MKCNICNTDNVFVRSYEGKHSGGWESDIYRCFAVIGSNTKNYACKSCGASNTLRHLGLFYDKLNIWAKYIKNKSVLLINPDEWTANNVNSLTNCTILKIKDELVYSEEYLDLIICNNVLQKIQNDIEFIKELYRILKIGGRLILQTPYSETLKNTFELDLDLKFIEKYDNIERQRQRLYGASDNKRVYGQDLIDKLSCFKADFKLSKDYITEEEAKNYYINQNESFMMFYK